MRKFGRWVPDTSTALFFVLDKKLTMQNIGHHPIIYERSMSMGRKQNRLVTQTFANDPDTIARLKQISHEKNMSMSLISRTALEIHLESAALNAKTPGRKDARE